MANGIAGVGFVGRGYVGGLTEAQFDFLLLTFLHFLTDSFLNH